MDRKDYIHVTTALKIIRSENLEKWRGNLGNQEADRIMHESGIRGTNVHKIISTVNLADIEKLHEYTELEKNMSKKIIFEWIHKIEFDTFDVEIEVYSDKYKYCGRLDMLMRFRDGSNLIVDFKTGAGIYPAYKLQLAAYINAAMENKLIDKPCDSIIVSINDKLSLKTELYPAKDFSINFNLFRCALNLYNHIGIS